MVFGKKICVLPNWKLGVCIWLSDFRYLNISAKMQMPSVINPFSSSQKQTNKQRPDLFVEAIL